MSACAEIVLREIVSNLQMAPRGSSAPRLRTRQPGIEIFASVSRGSRQDDEHLWLYRERTIGLLRRYLRLAMEVGRLPSLLGRQFFRTRVTAYSSRTFVDSTIFVLDVERALELLDKFDKALIAMIVLQEYTQEETARIMNRGVRTINRGYPDALDHTTAIFLDRGLLERLPGCEVRASEHCQEGRSDIFELSDSERRK